jgi:hypothetical protein
MSSLELVFSIPPVIEAGLASGSLQRVGGVIVESTSKQVVAWLREGGLEDVVRHGVPTPLNALLSASQIAVNAADGHLTRQAVNGLARQVQLGTTLAGFSVTGQVVNLALAAVSFRAIMSRLDQLSLSVAQLHHAMHAEFRRDRIVEFQTALEDARDVISGKRRDALNFAVNGLDKSRRHFLLDYEEYMPPDSEVNHRQLYLAQHYLILAMYAEISRVRCYAVCDEVEIARERLRETVAEFRQKVYRLIQALLGESPAVYFHQAVDTLVLGRYLYVQGWLHQNGEKTPTAVSEIDALLQIIDDLRADFFKSDLVKLQYRLNLPIGVPIKSEADFFAERIHALENAEVLIENFERLQGFEMELRELRLTDEVQSFQDWAVFGQTEMAAHNVSASLIVDTERLQRLMAV